MPHCCPYKLYETGYGIKFEIKSTQYFNSNSTSNQDVPSTEREYLHQNYITIVAVIFSDCNGEQVNYQPYIN